MHRYDEDTTGRVRVDYLHKMQKAYEIAVDNFKYTIANNKNPREVAKAEKHLTKITKQLKECKDYDEKISHLFKNPGNILTFYKNLVFPFLYRFLLIN